jgi:hypothetical protein
MKIISYFLIMAFLGLIACSGNDYSRKSMEKKISPYDLAGQGPLEQEDIDVYLKIIPESASFTNNMREGHITDPDLAISTFKKYGIDRYRLIFIQHKVNYGLFSSAGMSYSIPESFPNSLKITDKDIALVASNKTEILNAHSAYFSNKHN